MRYRTAIAVGATVFTVNLVSLALGWYKAFPSVDIPLHIGGGVAAGMFAIALHDDFKRRHKIGRTPRWYDLLFVLGFVSLVAIAWEFHEYVLDRTLVTRFNLAVSQISVGDTIGDFLNGLIGAAAAWIFGSSKLQGTSSKQTSKHQS
jgi:hypothetical protein